MNIRKAGALRRHLMLFTACTMVGGGLAMSAAVAQTASSTGPLVVPGVGAPDNSSAYTLKTVRVIYKKNLMKEKDLPGSVTDLDQKAVAAVNPTMGSVQTLLKQAPSVQAYTQGPGQSAPTLAIRGVKNDELAETLDGVPLSSFSGGTGDYLTNNIGAPITLGQIGSTKVYPGIAPPEDQGFGTVGGTIAYFTKAPTADPYAELEGGFGSFDTQHFGFTINTGHWWNSEDAPETIITYDQSQNAGYVAQTPAQYHDFLSDTSKTFDGGLTKVDLIVMFNQGKGSIQSTPTPVALINQYGWNYNFPRSLGYYNQSGQFLTTILHDQSYINPYLDFEGSLFYMHYSDQIDSYCAPSTVNGTYPYAVNVQCPYNFYGDIGPSTYHYSPGFFTYDPTASFGSPQAGESSEYTTGWGNRIGITPRLNIHLPDNTITVGGLLGKESGGGSQYIYGSDQAQENQTNGYDSFALGGGSQRTVFVGYVSDKIDLLDDKLHIEPGARVTAAYSSTITQMSSYYQNVKYQNYTKVGEPYIGISYDAPYNLTPYVTYGKGSLFSPLADYAGGLSGLPGTTHTPNPEIVHLYEAGLSYDTPELYLKADYFYQRINDGFSFYENYALSQFYYANDGGEIIRGVEAEMKAKLPDNFSVSGNFSWDNTDYTDSAFQFVTLQNDQFGYAYKGTPLSNTPSYLANLALDYDNGPYTAELSGQYTGREYQTTDILTPNDPTGQFSGATITDLHNTNDPNFILNFNASYKIPVHYSGLQSLMLTFTALNIADLHYFTYKYNSEIASGGVYSILPQYESGLIGPPRSLELDLVAHF